MAIIQAQPTAQPQSTFNSQAATIAQRKELAKALMAAQGQYDPNAQVSGYAVPTSGLQHAFNGLQTGLGTYLSTSAAKQEAELKDKQTAMLAQALQNKTPDIGALAQSGMLSEDALVKALMEKGKTNREGVPTGFNPVEGGITPQNIVMPGGDPTNYMDYQVKLAGEKAQLPGYGAPERLQMSIEDQAAQRRNEARAEEQAQQSNMMQQKNYELSARAQDRADAAANQPKQLSELQQYALDEKKAKKEIDRADALANIDDTVGEFERLKEIQNNTTTGPISGAPSVVAIRKVLPFNMGGGENLQRLEKGYNTMAVRAIGAFRAGGVSFGQLSNAEGAWIKSTQASLDAGKEVNQEVLNEGLKLLERRKERIMQQAAPKNSEAPPGTDKINIDIKHPENLSPADREALNADIQKEKGNAANVITQRSPSTGKIRTSSDGGKTWVMQP